MRRLVLPTVTAVVVLLMCEGAAWLFSAVTGRGGHEAAHAERALFLRQLPREKPPESTEPAGLEDAPWHAIQELHPYFGFVLDRSRTGVNNQGFPTPYTYPYAAAPDEYVVGIFGGSVADQLSEATVLGELLLPHLRSRGYRQVTILPLAIGATKQPSAFHVFVEHVDALDLAINVDGYNEIGTDRAIGTYPIGFPNPLVFGTLASFGSSPSVARDGALITLLTERAVAMTEFLQERPWKFSYIAHAIWRVRAARYQRDTKTLRAAIAAGSARSWVGVDPVERDGKDGVAARYRRKYADVTRYTHQIAEAEGKPFFHFIQPNQHVRDSKPYSREERDLYVRWDAIDPVTALYEDLETMSAGLLAAGVESHSLTRVFADVEETVYEDNCCHLNARGVELIHHAIANRIIASGRLQQQSRRDPTHTAGKEST